MDGPIFILGTMRSGSTLLRLVLDSHPRIAIGPESGFTRAFELLRTLPPWPSGPGWYRAFGLDDAEMDRRTAAMMASIFEDHARAQGKARWGDKTPHNLWHAARLAELYPAAQFVGIVRHPGAVADSMARRGRPFEDGVRMWNERNAELVRAGTRLGPRYATIRYEDLVRTPEVVLRPLLTFLGEEWSQDVLRHHEVHGERGDPRISDGGTRTDRALDPSRVDAWRRDLDRAGAAALRAVDTDLAHLLAYRTTGATDDVWDQPILDGDALAARARLLRLHLPVPTERTDTEPDPGRRRRAAARRVVTLARTDPAYTLRRTLDLTLRRATEARTR